MSVPIAADPAAVVITASQLNGIKRLAQPRMQQQKSERELKEDQLREISRSRYKNWENSVEALQRKKEQAKLDRIQKKEAEQLKLDREEAEYQRAEKEKVLKRAEELRFLDGDDRVKAVRSKLFLADVVMERQAQIDFQKKKKELVSRREADLTTKMLEIQSRDTSDSAAEEVRRKQADQQMATELKKQMACAREKWLAERKEELELGQHFRDEAERAAQEEKQRLQEKKKHSQATKLSQQEHLKNIEEQKRREKEQEQAELDMANAYLKLKEKKQEIFQAKMAERKKMKDERTERMVEYGSKLLIDMREQENARVAQQIKEQEQKEDNELERQRQQRELLLKECDQSRAEALERQKLQKEHKKVQDEWFKDMWRKKLEEEEEAAVKKQQEARAHAKAVQEFQRKQMEDREIREEQERQRIAAYSQYEHDKLKDEDERLTAFVKERLAQADTAVAGGQAPSTINPIIRKINKKYVK